MLFAAATLLLLIALFAIPVSLDFRLSWNEAFREDIRLSWAFGLVRVRVPLQRPSVADSSAEEKDKPKKNAGRSKRRRPSVRAILQQKAFRRRLFRFVSDLWRAVQKQNVSLRLRLGLGDPADTGMLWSVLGPVAGYLGTLEEVSVFVEPDFFETTLEFDGSGRFRLVPLQIVFLAGGLLMSPPFYRGIREMRAGAR